MNAQQEYADYIAFLFRETCRQTQCRHNTDECILIVPTYSELSAFNELLKMKIYVVDNLGGDDFKLSIPAENEQDRKWLAVFNDLKQSIAMGDKYDY